MRKHRRAEKEQVYQALLAHYVQSKRKRIIRYVTMLFIVIIVLLLLIF